MSARTRKDWILWGALGCALVATAHAEYTLATAAHFNKYVALAVPGALDLYVIRALQERRDVFVAVLAMVAANVASHLIVAGVLPVGWPVVSAVGAVAPLVVWRVYSLKYTRTRQELLWGLEAGAVSAPDEYVPVHLPPLEHGNEYSAPEAYPVESDPQVHVLTDPAAYSFLEYKLPPVPDKAPDYVPGDWMDDEYPETHPSAPAPVPHLKSVPDLPDEYAAGAVHSDVLRDSDYEFLGKATRYLDDVANPTVKGMKRALNIGQERAERLLAHLGVRP